MSDEDRSGAPFEEQAALEELERLQRAIQESQRRRRQASDAFDSFLQSFSTRSAAPAPDSSPTPAEQPIRLSPAVVAEPSVPAPTDPEPVEHHNRDQVSTDLPGWQTLVSYPREQPEVASLRSAPKPQLAAAQVLALPADESSAAGTGIAVPPAAPASERHVPSALLLPRSKGRGGMIGVGAALAAVVAIVMWRAWSPGPEGTPAPDGSSSPAAAAPAQAAPTAPVEVRVPRAELTTLRRVWVRVLIDGNPAPAIERELDANTRIPLEAEQRIVVRAGDAGSVRVSIAGKDQGPLGVEGQPVTKAFTLPPSIRR
jgi:hypothetical protein